jgi:apolipoprotein D and lipocalin family protein
MWGDPTRPDYPSVFLRCQVINRESQLLSDLQISVNFDAPYWVLDTDYDNYSVVWSCSNFGIFSTRKTNYLDIFSSLLSWFLGNAWILTRSRTPSLKTMEKAYSILDKFSISRAYFIRTDQKNCPRRY